MIVPSKTVLLDAEFNLNCFNHIVIKKYQSNINYKVKQMKSYFFFHFV